MSEDARCHGCGAPLDSSTSRLCPACERPQMRTCFCTAVIPRCEEACPQCGVDWATIDRLARERREEHGRYLRGQRIARWRNGLLLAVAGVGCIAMVWMLWLGR